MSFGQLHGNKKRNTTLPSHPKPIVECFPNSYQQAAAAQCTRSFPANKRLKGPDGEVILADPFGEDDDFTQDDLEEIDILASQAYTVLDNVTEKSTETGVPGVASCDKSVGQETATLMFYKSSDRSATADLQNATNAEKPRSSPYTTASDDLRSYCTKLEQKVKETEEHVLMKMGEIKVLRDSLRQLEQEHDFQKRSQLLVEKEKMQSQYEKEKELLKKVQSLQSELQFKDAEMNELKSKLQNCERWTKSLLPSTSKNSPRRSPSRVLRSESLTSIQGICSPFPTKESFKCVEAHIKPTPTKPQSTSSGPTVSQDYRNILHVGSCDMKSFSSSVSAQELSFYRLHEGVVLLSILHQLSQSTSSFEIGHLLTSTPNSPSKHFFNVSSITTREGSVGNESCPTIPLHLVNLQSLAVSGLHMLALEQGKATSTEGAVHVLPLLQFYIDMYYEALKPGKTCAEKSFTSSSTSLERQECFASEDFLLKLENSVVAALTVLLQLVSHSKDVLHCLLSLESKEETLENNFIAKESKVTSVKRAKEESLHPLFERLFEFVSFPPSSGTFKESTMLLSLNILNTLAENASQDQLLRFKYFLKGPAMLHVLSQDSSCHVASLTVRLLTATVDHEELAKELCLHADLCPLIALYTYAASRPDKSALEKSWLQLELEVVKLLMKLCTHNTATCNSLIQSSCQCSSEVVKTIIVILHRQWLVIKMHERTSQFHEGFWTSPCIQLIRQGLLLLHYLFQRDKNFPDHCLDVMHLYDQFILGVRDTFNKIPQLMDSEDMALEEMCPPDIEDKEKDPGL
ncbi:ATR-interacting protein isoform X1 [Polypterus senegalus]|uniref:ATR-interacting protein isoform X1 n=1 Tax=Polypterus senegalus TaxID=55291 RepID=UPI0019653BF0|nr:ATR-interacting protein isoform X1 [Polypterus senegalus]XP_039626777.1 ATR-interacting protein isoform X1 [Polypterus senegalus]XP_039626778.1 ATR-interacting protein isoform X1 [Polypterus senegalus]XP_039626779.1 ATR-interacting protein isoform X1 [Polypterus senegalus]XP_039626780.1 ATR-interacting protein isoform X1 [Polypterus senegalus]XP_039626781.1 ATR-interacting protein isoform X1 [Polypterus senegalus]